MNCKRKIKLLFVVLFLFGCRKVEKNNVQIIGHAACGLSNSAVPFQENTLAAIQFAFNYKHCDGVELDIQLSKDGELVLFHDQKMSPNTAKENCVSNYTYQELINTSYLSISKEKIAGLKQVEFKSDKTYYLDLRHYNYCEEKSIAVEEYITALNQINFGNTVTLSVSKLSYISPLKSEGYEVIFVANSESEALDAINKYNADGVELRLKNISTTFVKQQIAQGLIVGIYDVRAPVSSKKAIEMEPTFLSTDDLKKTINCLK